MKEAKKIFMGGRLMTDYKKKLEQMKHRLEEMEMRDRIKERKARTHRLIERGAILESSIPITINMTNDELKKYLFDISKK
jgi:hypothetical protein